MAPRAILGAAIVLTTSGAMGAAPDPSWRGDAPGRHHRIDADALPSPFATRSASNGPSEAPVPAGALPLAPPGFAVSRFGAGLDAPRALRVAPNGDVFVAETAAGRIRILRAPPGAPEAMLAVTFAENLDEPFGMAFYPPGPNPVWLYVADTNSVVRFPYHRGDLAAVGKPETIVKRLAPSTGGHSTRDIRFTPDGRRMLVSVGSGSNVAEDMPRLAGTALARFTTKHPLGATWGDETDRADVLSFTPDGGDRRIFATGLRNCVGLAMQPGTGTPWCAVNERDGLGDDLVPDYVTHVVDGAWYGWPWTYLGSHPDPRLANARPDLAGKATVPDVLIQSHSAPLGIVFYEAPPTAASAFPSSYAGDAFVTLHGSWNRALRTGYKVVRVHVVDGTATPGYDDFLTGFVASDAAVWGRPVGVAVASDGALLVSEDANGVVYRVAPAPAKTAR